MSDSKTYTNIDEEEISSLLDKLENWLASSKKLECQRLSGDEGHLIQAKSKQKWKKFIGMDKALQIQLILYNNDLTVNIGAGKWVDKAAAGAAGMVIFAPLLVTTALGAWFQHNLPKEIYSFIDSIIV